LYKVKHALYKHYAESRERARQARINKLANAVEALDIDNKENETDPVPSGRGLYCMLQPAEEDLVDRLLTQVPLLHAEWNSPESPK